MADRDFQHVVATRVAPTKNHRDSYRIRRIRAMPNKTEHANSTMTPREIVQGEPMRLARHCRAASANARTGMCGPETSRLDAQQSRIEQ
jgi:hypothetical protein